MSAYYNEFDPFAAQWLRNLIAEGLVAPGDVDERSITEVEPDDLEGYTQCHFFAGIGGWSYALRLAGWPDDRPVWTGSCPCQPFSAAGKQGGGDDERHLWPAWFRLARECRPDIILGEQVEGAVGFGWLDRVFADLENEGYACGATVLGAHSVGAPHIRQRLWWVGNSQCRRCESGHDDGAATEKSRSGRGICRVAYPGSERRDGEPVRIRGGQSRQAGVETAGGSTDSGMDDTTSPRHTPARPRQQEQSESGERLSSMGREDGGLGSAASQQMGRARQPWQDSISIQCGDGKIRRVPATAGQIEPALFPLVTRVSNRVGLLRGSGNAINPFTAAEFITAYMEVT